MKNKKYIWVLVVIFTAVYLLNGYLLTASEKEKNDSIFLRYRDSVMENVRVSTEMLNRKAVDGNEISEEYIENYLLHAISNADSEEKRGHRVAMAVYSVDGRKIEQTESTLSIYDNDRVYCYKLEKYFDEEEIAFIQQLYMDKKAAEEGASTPYWRIHAYVNEETMELAKLLFTTEYMFNEIDYEIAKTETTWLWVNPDESVHENLIPVGEYVHSEYDIYIPYLSQDELEHDEWNNHEFMQKFPEEWTDFSGPIKEESFKETRYEYDYTLCVGEKEYIIKYRHIYEPWLDAIDSMKRFYVGSAVFVMICLAIVVSNIERDNERRKILEETRQNFTNAIAHELKTPLGIIRGLAENSLENTNESKREYYLKQIVGQTEEMDKLVKEMVYISKLDSEEKLLKREPVHMETVIRSQLDKLAALSDDKNLNVRVSVNDEFIVQGDRSYLEKAIWNVLHNAIEYNHLDGFVLITIEKKEVRVENSGVKLKDDELPHVFDMFYTGDKSRTFGGKRMGLGLYLAKKILELHKMNITIGNTDKGVEVVMKS